MRLLACQDIAVRLGGRTVLDAVNASLCTGDLVGLLGPNGAGKTTLLRTLAGLQEPDSGQVSLLERPLTGFRHRELARIVGYLAQDAPCHWPMSVEKVVALGRLPHRAPWIGLTQPDRDAIWQAMDYTDVLHLANRTMDALSGGERSRVLLARAIAGAPRVLLADEPTNGLDPAHQLDVMDLLRRLAADGAAVVAVMHDLTLAARFCTCVLLLEQGRVLAAGTPQEVLTEANLERCFAIHAHTSVVAGQRLIVPLSRMRR